MCSSRIGGTLIAIKRKIWSMTLVHKQPLISLIKRVSERKRASKSPRAGRRGKEMRGYRQSTSVLRCSDDAKFWLALFRDPVKNVSVVCNCQHSIMKDRLKHCIDRLPKKKKETENIEGPTVAWLCPVCWSRCARVFFSDRLWQKPDLQSRSDVSCWFRDRPTRLLLSSSRLLPRGVSSWGRGRGKRFSYAWACPENFSYFVEHLGEFFRNFSKLRAIFCLAGG